MTPENIVSFWLTLDPSFYYKKDLTFDQQLKERFEPTLLKAATGTYDHWAETSTGALALVLLFDQMSRNIYRNTPQMYTHDPKALTIAKQALAKKFDQEVEAPNWFYMPFMHSENLDDQNTCVELFRAKGSENSFAIEHRDIIEKFGRFPHRNKILERTSTKEEQLFLKEGGFSG